MVTWRRTTWLGALGLWYLLCALSCTVEAQQSAELARQQFERGVASAAVKAWEDAASAFEASLALEDRAATRANLVRAYRELAKPLEVVRHALGFLALPEAPHRIEARASIERDLALAAAQLSVLTRESIPSGAELLVDGAPASVRDGAGRMYVVPGLHRLEARMLGAEPEVIEMELLAGQVVAWPRQGRTQSGSAGNVTPSAAPASSTPPSDGQFADGPPATPRASVDPRWRSRASLSFASIGVALEVAAVGTYLGTLHRAEDLRQRDPSKSGFLTSADDYQRLATAVAPLALVGGLLCAQAVAMGPRSSHWGAAPYAYGALGIGAALLSGAGVLVFRDSDRVGRSSVDEPDLQAAALVTGAALPLLTYGVSFFITSASKNETRAQLRDGSLKW